MQATPSLDAPQPHERRGRAASWLTLAAIGLVLAACVTALSDSRSYDQRLVDLAARNSLSEDLYRATAGSPVPQTLILDAGDDRELAFKIRLAADKYGERGLRVLSTYGSDPAFSAAMRQYGENIVPVLAFFMDNDFRSLKTLSWVKSTASSWAASEDGKPFDEYGPEMRGRHALSAISRRGHRFLAQFSIDASGTAHWNQVERGSQALTDLLAGGARNLETKYDRGELIGAGDLAAAGADVLVVFGAAKAVRFLQGAQAEGAARGASAVPARSLVRATAEMGPRILNKGLLGPAALRWGGATATVYLALRHPSLLNGVFERLGALLSIPPWLAKFVGWSLVSLPLVMVAGPALAAFGVLIPVVRLLVRVGWWLWPWRRSSQNARL